MKKTETLEIVPRNKRKFRYGRLDLPNIVTDTRPQSPLFQVQKDIIWDDVIQYDLLNKLKVIVVGYKSAVGLSFNQTVYSELYNMRICIVREKAGESYRLLVNPYIIEGEGEIESKEGCLSYPHKEFMKKRYTSIRVRHLTEKGVIEEWFSGFLAIVIQHEVDHLDGKNEAI